MGKSRKNSLVACCDNDWQTENDLRTLMEAEQIKKDSKRFKKAQTLAKTKMLEVASIASEESCD